MRDQTQVDEHPRPLPVAERARLETRARERAEQEIESQDVSALKRALREAEDARAQLRDLLEVAPDGIVVWNESRPVFANRSFLDLFGVSDLRDFDVRPVAEHFEEPDRTAFLHWLSSEMVFDRRFLEVSLRQGEERYHLQIRRMPLVFDGQPCVLLMVRDITEPRRMAAVAETNSRLASLGLLVAGVGHEVNNPLAFMLPNLDDVISNLKQLPLDTRIGARPVSDIIDLAQDARDGARRVAKIVTDLRTFHSVERDLELVNVNDVIAETLRLAATKLAQRAVVERHLGRLPWWHGRPGRLGQVVLNLVLNASQAMPDFRPETENRVTVRSWSCGDEILIEVSDNGCGIPAGKLARIFDPFFTTRPGGSGLGLSVCKNLVEQMGGGIEVKSEVDVGTVFTLHLPMRTPADPERPQETPAHGLPSLRSAPRLRLLFVDDEGPLRKTVCRVLSDEVDVIVAESVAGATRLLESNAEIDVVISDLIMASGGGEQLLAKVRQLRPELITRFAFMTGMTRAEAMPEGVDAVPHLQKPFRPEDLLLLVRRLALDPADARTPAPVRVSA
jgi:PAS domain S-box-containing protein